LSLLSRTVKSQKCALFLNNLTSIILTSSTYHQLLARVLISSEPENLL